MKYRIAKRCDLDHIVDLHLKVREVYDIGFFSKKLYSAHNIISLGSSILSNKYR